MQVSWIDPDEVRDLIKQLEGPKKSSTGSAWELHTLPTAQVPPPAFEPLLSDASTPRPQPVEPLPEDPPLSEARPAALANAELWRIRERLRVLRDKAQTAGILSHVRPETASAPIAPEPASEPPAPTPPPSVAEIHSGSGPEASTELPPSPTAEREELSPVQPTSSPAEEQVEEQVLPNPPIREEPVLTAAPAPAIPLESPFAVAEPPAPVYEPLFSSAPPDIPGNPPASEMALPVSLPTAPPPPVIQSDDVPFTVSNLGLSERLNAVAEWVCNRLSTREVLLVDDYGDVLWGAQGQTALVLSAMMAWHSAQRASASATCIDPERIDRPLPQGRSLTVLPLRTRYGVVSLAVIDEEPVGEADAIAIRRALALAVEGTTGTSSNEDA